MALFFCFLCSILDSFVGTLIFFIVEVIFLIYFVALGVSHGLHTPNLKAMNRLMAEMAAGPPPEGGPPPQVAELEARGKKAGMYGGILHLLFVAILLDMILKPGWP